MALGSLASSKYSQHQEYRLLEKCFLSFPLIVSSFAETPTNMKGIWNKGVIFSPGRSMEKKERQRKKPNEEYISFPLAICHLSKVNECVARSIMEEKMGEVLKETLPQGQWPKVYVWFSSFNSYILYQFLRVEDFLECANSITACRSLVIS